MIKHILILFLLAMISTSCLADTELLFGSLTQHTTNFDGVSSAFSNKVSADGTLIANALVAYRHVSYGDKDHYSALAAVTGMNSIGEPMAGAVASIGLSDGKKNRFGVIGGAYLQDYRQFTARGLVVPGFHVADNVQAMPIVGLEGTLVAPLTKKTNGLVNLIVTPFLLNLSLGIGF